MIEEPPINMARTHGKGVSKGSSLHLTLISILASKQICHTFKNIYNPWYHVMNGGRRE